jgi:hypothetical protein
MSSVTETSTSALGKQGERIWPSLQVVGGNADSWRETLALSPAPFHGDLLQVMPWPNFQNMTDHDLRAIYEYLSAIPCIDTIIPGQPQLRNNCS